MYPIHLMTKSSQDLAKSYLTGNGWGIPNIWTIPGVNGVGIGEGFILVTVDHRDPLQDQIPSALGSDTSFEGLPVVIKETGEFEPLQQRGGSQGGGSLVQGGVKISVSGEYGTCTGVYVDSQQKKYACTSSHVFSKVGMGGNVSVGGQVVGKVAKDARKPCGKQNKVYLDIAAALLNQGVQSSFNIIGLGEPKGFEKATVGMAIHSNGQNSGKVDQKVTAINYSLVNDTGGNCPVNFTDCWIGSVRSRPGESGSAFWNDKGNIVGICTTNNNQGSVNCSMWYLPQVLGLNVAGAIGGGQQQSPQRQQAQRTRTAKAYGGWLTVA